MNRLESLTEKKLREAIEQGEFDNLPGKGKPVDLEENPFEDPNLRVVHRLLRNAGFAPAWIEERKDIDLQLEAALTKLKRGWHLFRESPAGAEWERCLREFRVIGAELNERIRMYNLRAPAAVFHRKHIDADRIIEQLSKTNS